jgi:BirA family biotin operon repressor/biotin-[acetyl-CoA-carboxylase] ligase
MLGVPRVHHRATDSTNERAKELALAGAPHGTLVTADEQSAGRGRQGRAWTAPPGSALLMSLVLRELDPLLPLAAAVAVCEALPGDADARIKWPNDVWLERRKLAGILVEGRVQEGWAVLGIGLNVSTDAFPDELAEIATSLRLSGFDLEREPLLAELLHTLERRLATPEGDLLAAWTERDALRGERVRWDGGEGTAAGIDRGGSLIVQTEEGRTTTLAAGEVHLLR